MEKINDKQIVLSVVQSGYKEFTYTIPAYGSEIIYYAHNTLRLLSFTGTRGDLAMVIGANGDETIFTGAGISYVLPSAVDRVKLVNKSASSITLTVAMIIGDIRDDRLTVSNIVSVEEVTPDNGAYGAVSLTASTATQILAANANGVKTLIQNNNAYDDLYIGYDSGLTINNGIRIPKQGSIELSTTKAIFGISISTCDVRYLTETR